jgi:hypothetical protein
MADPTPDTSQRSLSDLLAEMTDQVTTLVRQEVELAIALREAGIDLALLGSRHVARLRGALSGKSKSDSTRSCCRAPVSCSLCSPRRCRTRPRWRCSAPAVADTSC